MSKTAFSLCTDRRPSSAEFLVIDPFGTKTTKNPRTRAAIWREPPATKATGCRKNSALRGTESYSHTGQVDGSSGTGNEMLGGVGGGLSNKLSNKKKVVLDDRHVSSFGGDGGCRIRGLRGSTTLGAPPVLRSSGFGAASDAGRNTLKEHVTGVSPHPGVSPPPPSTPPLPSRFHQACWIPQSEQCKFTW